MKDIGTKMLIAILIFVLCSTSSVYTAAPLMTKICLEGIEYYRAIENTGGSFLRNTRGYGFIAPVIDAKTLSFVRCKEELNNEH